MPLVPTVDPEKIRKDVATEVEAEIGSEVGAIEAAVAAAERDAEARGVGIDRLFGTLQPSVEASVGRLREAFGDAYTAERGVFSEAKNRLNQLRQQSAAGAQALAQQVGGPINLAEFEAATLGAQYEMPHAEAGALLHSLGTHRAGLEEGEAFAGRVFPLLHKEERARVRDTLQERVTQLQDEIKRIRGAKGGLVSKRFNERLVQERTHALQQAQQELDRIRVRDERDFRNKTLKQQALQNRRQLEISRKQLDHDQQRINIARDELDFNYKELSDRTTTDQQRLALDREKFEADKRLNQQTLQLNYDKMAFDQEMTASELLSDYGTGGTKTVTRSEAFDVTPDLRREADETDAEYYARLDGKARKLNPDSYWEIDPADGKRHYYIIKDVKTPVDMGGGADTPRARYEFLLKNGIPRPVALKVIREAYPNFKPGGSNPKPKKPPAQRSG